MKRALVIAVTLAFAAVLMCGCAGPAGQQEQASAAATEAAAGGPEGAPKEDKPFTVGVCWGAMDATPAKLNEYLTDMFEEKGWVYHQTNADNNTEKQVSDIESLCQLGCDVIVFRGASSIIGPTLINVCNSYGVPVISLTSFEYPDLDGKFYFCGDPSGARALVLADYVNKWLKEDPARTARTAIIVGDYSSDNNIPRTTSFMENVEGATIVVENQADPKWSSQGGMAVMEDWLQKYTKDDIDIILCWGDEMCRGAIEALKANNFNPDDFLVLSYDGLDIVYEYIKEGWIDATSALDIEKHAQAITDTLQTFKDGKSDSLDYYIGAHTIHAITTENLQGILDGVIEREYLDYNCRDFIPF